MKKLIATLATFSLGIALALGAWAQNADQGKEKGNDPSDVQTIRGVVAGVTAEGELVVDYRTKKAVMVQAAYLTIVGSEDDSKAAKAKAKDSDRKGKEEADKDDDDDEHKTVYIAWISPRTKVYEASGEPGKPGPKKEVTLDAVDVGDQVEVQLNPREMTEADSGANQTESMRRKHGRSRIVIGDAMAITILPMKDDDKSKDDKSNRDKDK
jgi:hypothetical protein